MGRLALLWMLGAGIPTTPPGQPTLTRFEFDRVEMAVPIKLALYAPDSAAANRAAEAAFDRIRRLNRVFSDYDPESELRRLCDTAGEGRATPVSGELWRVLCVAEKLSHRSEGAFDVTVGPVVRLWRRARRQHELPDIESVRQARELVGYQLVRLDPKQQAVELLKRGMRLDLGGIAKGFVVDEALAVLRKQGIGRAMVHAGGDIGLGDPPPDKPGWTIGVAPVGPEGPPTLYLSLSRCSTATSGDIWQYVEIGGKRYSHIVDPKTGLGLTDRILVTVVAPDGITADGLATAVSVLGPDKGLKLVEETPGAAALILRGAGDKPESFRSSRWKDLPVVHPQVPEKD